MFLSLNFFPTLIRRWKSKTRNNIKKPMLWECNIFSVFNMVYFNLSCVFPPILCTPTYPSVFQPILCIPTYSVYSNLSCVFQPILCIPTYVFQPILCIPTYPVYSHLSCVFPPILVYSNLSCVFQPILCIPTYVFQLILCIPTYLVYCIPTYSPETVSLWNSWRIYSSMQSSKSSQILREI